MIIEWTWKCPGCGHDNRTTDTPAKGQQLKCEKCEGTWTLGDVAADVEAVAP